LPKTLDSAALYRGYVAEWQSTPKEIGTMANLINRSRIVAAFAAILAASSFVAPSSSQAQSSQSASGRSLEGAWWVNVTLYDCASGAKRPTFASILTFARGGTLSETTSNPLFQAGQRSTGFGTWGQTAGETYSASDEAFILFSAAPFTQGVQRLDHSIRFSSDNDHFEDEATVEFFDMHGSLLTSGCATAVGVRLR